MSVPNKSQENWTSAFLPLGRTVGNTWDPCGGSVLLIDPPFVWLVTARSVAENETEPDNNLSTWVPTGDGLKLLDITASQQQSGVHWIHHPAGLSATLFPISATLQVRAFAETQVTRVRDLQPLLPTVSVGALYGPDAPNAQHPVTAVCDGIISAADPQSGVIYSTAPMMPNNAGAPLLLASPYGKTVTVAGVLLANADFASGDPREVPVRLSRAICIDAALELIRGKDAQAQQQLATAKQSTPPPVDEQANRDDHAPRGQA